MSFGGLFRGLGFRRTHSDTPGEAGVEGFRGLVFVALGLRVLGSRCLGCCNRVSHGRFLRCLCT